VGYNDRLSFPTRQDDLGFVWNNEGWAPGPTEPKIGFPLAGALAVSAVLLAAGFGLLFLRHGLVLAALRQALDTREKLAREHPSNADYRSDLARAYYDLGYFWHHTHRCLPEAEAAYCRAVALQRKLVDDHPLVLTWQQELARTYVSLGMLYYSTQRLNLAEAAYRQAVSLFEKSVEAYPTETEHVFDLAVTCGLLGDVTRDSDRTQPALEWFGQAIRGIETVLHLKKEHARAKEFLPTMHRQRAQILSRLGRHAEAIQEWDWVIEQAEGAECDEARLARALELTHTEQNDRATSKAEALTNRVPDCT
jgi:tetratricopeptide (TPR) repeat protein